MTLYRMFVVTQGVGMRTLNGKDLTIPPFPGYVMSKEALRRVVETGLLDSTKCSAGIKGAEDVELGKCLQNLEVTCCTLLHSSSIHRIHR